MILVRVNALQDSFQNLAHQGENATSETSVLQLSYSCGVIVHYFGCQGSDIPMPQMISTDREILCDRFSYLSTNLVIIPFLWSVRDNLLFACLSMTVILIKIKNHGSFSQSVLNEDTQSYFTSCLHYLNCTDVLWMQQQQPIVPRNCLVILHLAPNNVFFVNLICSLGGVFQIIKFYYLLDYQKLNPETGQQVFFSSLSIIKSKSTRYKLLIGYSSTGRHCRYAFH